MLAIGTPAPLTTARLMESPNDVDEDEDEDEDAAPDVEAEGFNK